MKKNKFKVVSIVLIILSIISISINAYAHSGRTDSNGGHRDNKNKSGLGSYHYHCGGYPAHLHTNGVCPYTSNSTQSNSSAQSSSSNLKETSAKPTTVDVTDVEINEEIESLEVGESKTLTVTITPSNATDKNITWKSSDETIATVSESGVIIAKAAGTVDITAISSNEKTATVKINIKELPKIENTDIIKTSTSSQDNITNNTTTNNNNEDDSNPFGGIVTLGVLGGGYWGYKKYRNR